MLRKNVFQLLDVGQIGYQLAEANEQRQVVGQPFPFGAHIGQVIEVGGFARARAAQYHKAMKTIHRFPRLHRTLPLLLAHFIAGAVAVGKIGHIGAGFFGEQGGHIHPIQLDLPVYQVAALQVLHFGG